VSHRGWCVPEQGRERNLRRRSERGVRARPYGWSPCATAHLPGPLVRLARWSSREKEISEPNRSDRSLTNSVAWAVCLVPSRTPSGSCVRSTAQASSPKTSSGWRSRRALIPAPPHKQCVRRWRVKAAELRSRIASHSRSAIRSLGRCRADRRRVREAKAQRRPYLLNQQAQSTADLLDQHGRHAHADQAVS